MREVRVCVKREGNVKYISQLDMYRMMLRTVRRAEIPLWYTEGFNPHPYLSFLLPLPLGVEGDNEPLDMKIENDMTDEAILEALRGEIPSGFGIVSVKTAGMKPDKIAYGSYEIKFGAEDGINTEELCTLLTCGELFFEKSGKSRGKKVIKTVNASEHIKNHSLTEKDGVIILRVTLPAGSVFNINPLQLIEAMENKKGAALPYLNVKRTALLTENEEIFE